jgi:hypothetical protein
MANPEDTLLYSSKADSRTHPLHPPTPGPRGLCSGLPAMSTWTFLPEPKSLDTHLWNPMHFISHGVPTPWALVSSFFTSLWLWPDHSWEKSIPFLEEDWLCCLALLLLALLLQSHPLLWFKLYVCPWPPKLYFSHFCPKLQARFIMDTGLLCGTQCTSAHVVHIVMKPNIITSIKITEEMTQNRERNYSLFIPYSQSGHWTL